MFFFFLLFFFCFFNPFHLMRAITEFYMLIQDCDLDLGSRPQRFKNANPLYQLSYKAVNQFWFSLIVIMRLLSHKNHANLFSSDQYLMEKTQLIWFFSEQKTLDQIPLFPWGFFAFKLYQWLKNWYSAGHPAVTASGLGLLGLVSIYLLG